MENSIFDKDFLCIKEFAELAGMTTSTLRHYDSKGLFTTAKRGSTSSDRNYRSYAPTQITMVKMVRVLTEIGIPLQTIKELSQDRTPEKMFKLLTKHKVIISNKLRFLQEVLSVMGTFTDLPDQMTAFANQHGLEFTGPVYNQYLFDEISTTAPEQYLLQVAASVRETQRTLSRKIYLNDDQYDQEIPEG